MGKESFLPPEESVPVSARETRKLPEHLGKEFAREEEDILDESEKSELFAFATELAQEAVAQETNKM